MLHDMSFNYLVALEILQEFLLNNVKLMACQSNSIDCHKNADGRKKNCIIQFIVSLPPVKKHHFPGT